MQSFNVSCKAEAAVEVTIELMICGAMTLM